MLNVLVFPVLFASHPIGGQSQIRQSRLDLGELVQGFQIGEHLLDAHGNPRSDTPARM